MPMILALFISIFLMGLFILLHFSQHFRCRSCKDDVNRLFDTNSFPKQKSLPSERTATIHQTLSNFTDQQHLCRFNWCCAIKGDLEFDFFPLSFLLYMIFVMILSGLIIIKYIHEDHHDANLFFLNDNIFENSKQLTRLTQLPRHSNLDWIIYCFLLIAMIWESLFSFYRYYTTIISAKFFYSLSFMAVLKRYLVYVVIFMIIFIIQTQFYYWCFPLVFIGYFIPNIYWISTVAHLLIKSYKRLTESLDADFECNSFQTDLVRSVKLMRFLSIISAVLLTINMTAFIVIYDMRIIYYFPITWSLSMGCFACNFVRNRSCIIEKVCQPLLLFFKNQKHHKHPKHPHPKDPKHPKTDASVPSTILQLVTTQSTVPPLHSFKPREGGKAGDKLVLEFLEHNQHIDNRRISLPVHIKHADKQKLFINRYISHSDPLVMVKPSKPETIKVPQPQINKQIETPLSLPNLHNATTSPTSAIETRNKSHSLPTKIERKKRIRKRRKRKNVQLPLIHTDYHNITINTKYNPNIHTKSSTTKSKSAQKALILLGLSPSRPPAVTPILCAPPVTPASVQQTSLNPSPIDLNEDNLEYSDDGMIILYDEDDPIGMDSILPNLKLETIKSDGILPDGTDPDTIINQIPQYHATQRKQTLQTPSSVVSNKNLMLDYFAGTSADTMVIDESMDWDQIEEATSKQLQLQSQFYHQTAPTITTAPKTTARAATVTAAPTAANAVSPTITNALSPTITNAVSPTITYKPEDSPQISRAGDLMIVPQTKTIRSSSNPLLLTFREQRKRTFSDEEKSSKPTTHSLAPPFSRHTKDNSESVLSVLNLFAAQGFCSKMTVNSVHQIQQLSSKKLLNV